MNDFAVERARLLEQLRMEIKSSSVLDAMARVPRELFIPAESYSLAYQDRPLPIGYGQTISQPFIVALMTQEMALKGCEKVLELGTGSGYQAAVLAELAREVVTVERIPQLIRKAGEVLSSLGYRNIAIHEAGENLGWPGEAPYDAIIVTAGAPQVPRILLDQLAVGGRLIVPIGPACEQELLKVTKLPGSTVTVDLGGCRFVPLIGVGAWPATN